MQGEQLELEWLAEEVRRRAHIGQDENQLATTTVVRLLGTAGLVVDRNLRRGAFLRQRDDGSYQIVVSPTFPDVRHAIHHELGHYAIRAIACATMSRLEEERAANYLAAAISAPMSALRRVHAFFGDDLRKLKAIASSFGLSQTSAQLRLGEVLGDDRAIVTAKTGFALTRGDGWGSLPLLKLARGERRAPGVAKTTLRGGIDEGRVALRVR